MSKNFDDLSDDFLNEDDNKENKNNDDEKSSNDSIPFNMEHLPPNLLNILKAITDIDDSDNTSFDKKTWDTEFGSVTRIKFDEIPEFGININDLFSSAFKKNNTESDEDLLKKAIESEDYLKAAEIRDIISKKNKSIDNTDTASDSEGDFWDTIK